jgi:hypothetical protein
MPKVRRRDYAYDDDEDQDSSIFTGLCSAVGLVAFGALGGKECGCVIGVCSAVIGCAVGAAFGNALDSEEVRDAGAEAVAAGRAAGSLVVSAYNKCLPHSSSMDNGRNVPLIAVETPSINQQVTALSVQPSL